MSNQKNSVLPDLPRWNQLQGSVGRGKQQSWTDCFGETPKHRSAPSTDFGRRERAVIGQRVPPRQNHYPALGVQRMHYTAETLSAWLAVSHKKQTVSLGCTPSLK